MDSHPFAALMTAIVGIVIATLLRMVVISEIVDLPRAIISRYKKPR